MNTKLHTTNYFNTFIEVAEDTKAVCGAQPPSKDKRTVAEIQYQLIAKHPYQYTSDDILFQVYANRKDLTNSELPEARDLFFSKGQPCFRASPLTKSYGFGIHYNQDGKIALYGMETNEYQGCLLDPNIKKVKAMKSNK